MPAIIPFIPLIAAGVGTAGSIYSANKASSASNPALNAQAGLAGQQADQAKQLFNFGMPNLQKASNYYGALLGGNRAAVTSELAPTVNQISDVYKGAARNLTKLPAGPGRDEATAALSTQRAGQIGGLPLQARQGAAQDVANLGQVGVSGGVGATASAGGLFGSLAQQQFQRQQYGDQQNYAFGNNLSKILTDFIGAYRNRNTGSGGDTGTSYGAFL